MSAQKAAGTESDAQSPIVEVPWPSTLIGSNISCKFPSCSSTETQFQTYTYHLPGTADDVPLKSKSAGVNIRKAIRNITVRLAGKTVSGSARVESALDVEGATAATSIRLLDEVNVEFKRGRMTCLMGTSGAGGNDTRDRELPLFY